MRSRMTAKKARRIDDEMNMTALKCDKKIIQRTRKDGRQCYQDVQLDLLHDDEEYEGT